MISGCFQIGNNQMEFLKGGRYESERTRFDECGGQGIDFV